MHDREETAERGRLYFRGSHMRAILSLRSLRRCTILAVPALACCNPASTRAVPLEVTASNGPQIQSSTPNVAAPPVLSTASRARDDRARWKAALKWSDACEEAFAQTRADARDAQLEFYEVAPHKYIVSVGCAAGAYQPSQVLALWDESTMPAKGRLVRLPLPPKYDDAETFGLISRSANGKGLEFMHRSNGLGDCGFLATYQYANDGLSLVELRARDVCKAKSGNHSDPHEWAIMPIKTALECGPTKCDANTEACCATPGNTDKRCVARTPSLETIEVSTSDQKRKLLDAADALCGEASAHLALCNDSSTCATGAICCGIDHPSLGVSASNGEVLRCSNNPEKECHSIERCTTTCRTPGTTCSRGGYCVKASTKGACKRSKDCSAGAICLSDGTGKNGSCVFNNDSRANYGVVCADDSDCADPRSDTPWATNEDKKQPMVCDRSQTSDGSLPQCRRKH